MRDWVKPFLIQDLQKTFDEIKWASEEEKKDFFKRKVQEFENKEAIYYRLPDFLNTYFGGAIGHPQETFIHAFGSVLADLPKEIFDKLRQMKTLFIAFCSFRSAEVTFFEAGQDIKADDRLIIAIFPYASSFLSYKALRGEIAHELAHVYAEHLIPDKIKFGAEAEDEADELAKNWGVEEEINANKRETEALKKGTPPA